MVELLEPEEPPELVLFFGELDGFGEELLEPVGEGDGEGEGCSRIGISICARPAGGSNSQTAANKAVNREILRRRPM